MISKSVNKYLDDIVSMIIHCFNFTQITIVLIIDYII